MKSDENVRHGFTGTCDAAQGNQSKKQLLLPSPREELLGSLNGVTMWAGPWIGQETKLRWSVYPLVDGIMCSVWLWHLRYGSWFVAFFFGPVAWNCPSGWCMQLFSVTYRFLVGFPGGASGKEPVCQCRTIRDVGWIPEVGRFLGAGHGNPLQYSCLKNPMDRDPHGLQSIGSHRVRHNWSDLAHTHSVFVTV